MIIGVGIDVVPVERFAASLARTPGLRHRLFTAAEQVTPAGVARTGESLAARFAAKEALAKALGAPGDLHWHDAEVAVGAHGRPHLEVRARGARTIVIAEDGDEDVVPYADHLIRVPRTPTLLAPVVTTVPLQVLACEIADTRGLDVDQPRNLAKSVTVE